MPEFDLEEFLKSEGYSLKTLALKEVTLKEIEALKPYFRWLAVLGLVLTLALVWAVTACSRFDAPIGIQAVPRDAFPVFDNPDLLTVEEAEAMKMVRDQDAVIGITMGGEARAYPIDVMGVHELGNDTIAGVPIAVTW